MFVVGGDFAAAVGFGVGVGDSGEASALLIRKNKSAVAPSRQMCVAFADGGKQVIDQVRRRSRALFKPKSSNRFTAANFNEMN